MCSLIKLFLISSTELKFKVFSFKNYEFLNKAFNPYLIPLKVDCPLFHNNEIHICSMFPASNLKKITDGPTV